LLLLSNSFPMVATRLSTSLRSWPLLCALLCCSASFRAAATCTSGHFQLSITQELTPLLTELGAALNLTSDALALASPFVLQSIMNPSVASLDGTCVACLPGCQSCSSLLSCSSCANGFTLTNLKKILASSSGPQSPPPPSPPPPPATLLSLLFGGSAASSANGGASKMICMSGNVAMLSNIACAAASAFLNVSAAAVPGCSSINASASQAQANASAALPFSNSSWAAALSSVRRAGTPIEQLTTAVSELQAGVVLSSITWIADPGVAAQRASNAQAVKTVLGLGSLLSATLNGSSAPAASNGSTALASAVANVANVAVRVFFACNPPGNALRSSTPFQSAFWQTILPLSAVGGNATNATHSVGSTVGLLVPSKQTSLNCSLYLWNALDFLAPPLVIGSANVSLSPFKAAAVLFKSPSDGSAVAQVALDCPGCAASASNGLLGGALNLMGTWLATVPALFSGFAKATSNATITVRVAAGPPSDSSSSGNASTSTSTDSSVINHAFSNLVTSLFDSFLGIRQIGGDAVSREQGLVGMPPPPPIGGGAKLNPPPRPSPDLSKGASAMPPTGLPPASSPPATAPPALATPPSSPKAIASPPPPVLQPAPPVLPAAAAPASPVASSADQYRLILIVVCCVAGCAALVTGIWLLQRANRRQVLPAVSAENTPRPYADESSRSSRKAVTVVSDELDDSAEEPRLKPGFARPAASRKPASHS